MNSLLEYYTWILVFHLMAMMSWMAMLFYQPRLFVYHTEHKNKKEFVEVVKIQEDKMYKIIGFPAKIATVLSGIVLIILRPDLLQGGGWMHAKLFFVILLIGYSFSLEYFRKRLKEEKYPKSGNFFRAYNEVPTILSLLIIGYAMTKTFSMAFTFITLLVGAYIIYKVMNQKPKDNIISQK